MDKLSRAYFEALLVRTDRTGMNAIGRALVVLTERHAVYDASRGVYAEGDYGFFASDAGIGISMAAHYQRRGSLTIPQICVWQIPRNMQPPRIYRYIDQLLRVAHAKRTLHDPENDIWRELNLAVWEYYDVIDSDLAEFIDPAEDKVKTLAAKLGMDFVQALTVCGSGEVSGVMKN